MKDLLPALSGLLGFLVLLTAISTAPFLLIYVIYSLVVWKFIFLGQLLATWFCSIIVGLLLIVLSNVKLKRKLKDY